MTKTTKVPTLREKIDAANATHALHLARLSTVAAPPPPDAVGDGVSVGFRLLCLDRAIDFAEQGAPVDTVLAAAEAIRCFLLAGDPVASAKAATPTLN